MVGLPHLSARVVDFLSAGARTGMLGYVAADGRPLVAPVWFVLDRREDNDDLVFNTGRESAKGRAQGTASVQDGAEYLLEIATRIGGRYLGAHRAKEFGQRNAVPGELVMRVQPTKVNSACNIAD